VKFGNCSYINLVAKTDIKTSTDQWHQRDQKTQRNKLSIFHNFQKHTRDSLSHVSLPRFHTPGLLCIHRVHYACRPCGFDVHPICSQLPRADLPLHPEHLTKCSRCEACDFNLHPKCLFRRFFTVLGLLLFLRNAMCSYVSSNNLLFLLIVLPKPCHPTSACTCIKLSCNMQQPAQVAVDEERSGRGSQPATSIGWWIGVGSCRGIDPFRVFGAVTWSWLGTSTPAVQSCTISISYHNYSSTVLVI
jgi:hypothetical protein